MQLGIKKQHQVYRRKTLFLNVLNMVSLHPLVIQC